MLIDVTMQVREAIPHEAGAWVDFRHLSWTQLQRARQVRESEALRSMREIGGDLLGQLAQLQTGQAGQPGSGEVYDRQTLLVLGIAGWSYAAPVSAETVAQLDQATAEWAYQTLCRINGGAAASERGNA